jgi:DNA-binding protein HU-beta
MDNFRGNMNKTDLIEIVAKNVDMSKAAAGRALDAVISAITDSLGKGKPVALVGFGTFVVNKRKQRAGRNPQTGAAITIPAAKVPRFKAGKYLKTKVNGK